ncbi:hypothetical protein BH10PSE4_BH10PSE4_26540 [soil metagenome]
MIKSTTTPLTAMFAGLALAAASQGAVQAQALQVSQAGDAQLSCEQLQAEVARMDQMMGASNTAISGAEGSSRMAQTGASLGLNAAMRSGALARMPGLGMFANAAASAARASAEAKVAHEGEQIAIAQQRRAIMNGVYQGKGCGTQATVTTVSTRTMPATAPSSLSLTSNVGLRATASPSAAVVRAMTAGNAVYPTGQRNGVWIEVDDEQGNRGWVSSAMAVQR